MSVGLANETDVYTIEQFWIPRLGQFEVSGPYSLVRGWSFREEGFESFKEAPLTQSVEEFGSDADPRACSILLVSAPGAVGKSTLAQEIALRTGSVYVDLAEAGAVGANALSGGLVRSGLYSEWKRGTVTVLVDGLDEAALKTSREALDAFLSDVADLSAGRPIPTVIFGRTGSIQDAWLRLAENNSTSVAVLEIGYYRPSEAVEFAEAKLTAKSPEREHPLVDREAIELLLEALRTQTAKDNNRFAGYAPVLQAVAERVAQEPNPSQLVAQMQQGSQLPITLQSIVSDILVREQSKLGTLTLTDATLVDELYGPDEQLGRLAARIYGTPAPPLPAMGPEDADTYSNALESWVGQHPFLRGEADTASAVFEAAIAARALKTSNAADRALQHELERGDAANPFLHNFYLGDNPETETTELPSEHIGVIYSSIRASLAQGESASLWVEELEENGDSKGDAEVEIEVVRRDAEDSILLHFETQADGTIFLGSVVKDVFISSSQAEIVIGQGRELILVAPVALECQSLSIKATKVIVDKPADSDADAVALQGEALGGDPLTTVPLVRNNAKLFVTWPNADAYPWTNFAAEPLSSDDNDPIIREGLRRFRNFIIEFRANKNGGLARSRNKIESRRMTKGSGVDVLQAMLTRGIVQRDGGRYFLDTDVLGQLTETTYADCMAFQFGSKAVDFVREAVIGNSN